VFEWSCCRSLNYITRSYLLLMALGVYGSQQNKHVYCVYHLWIFRVTESSIGFSPLPFLLHFLSTSSLLLILFSGFYTLWRWVILSTFRRYMLEAGYTSDVRTKTPSPTRCKTPRMELTPIINQS
jgi:hypothetical protein